jgi:predicted O-methyltransferase YrrM
MANFIKKKILSKFLGLHKLFLRKKKVPIDWVLRNKSTYDLIGSPGQLTKEVFEEIQRLPGWFNFDDCAHFYLVLSMQSALGVKGDLFEIGSYHGRSTTLMAYCLKQNENIYVCDAFDIEAEDSYFHRPTPEGVLENILRVNPSLDPSHVIIHKCLSDELKLVAENRFRFIHIDGGHSKEQTFQDLILSEKHLINNGIIAIDDFCHPVYPGVKEGVREFLAIRPNFLVLADLNRHGAFGRKLYIVKLFENDLDKKGD